MATTPTPNQSTFTAPKPASAGGTNTQPTESRGSATAASAPTGQQSSTPIEPPKPVNVPEPAPTPAVNPQPVTIVPATTTAVAPDQASPDGTDPSQYPHNGTQLDGLARGVAGNNAAPAHAVGAAVLNGNPPAYDDEAKPAIDVQAPTAPKRVVEHMKMADFETSGVVYKLGVSHPPYVVESVAKGAVVLRAGTGGTVVVTNDSEASFFTNDQGRQYAVADGNPNVNGDVKAP